MSAPPLRFEAVAIGRDETLVTLDVSSHESVLVIGSEASGVGDLPAFALGLDAPRRGTARIFGENLSALGRRAALAFRRRVGYLPAGDGLLQNLSLRDNIALPLRFGGDRPEREIAGRIRVMTALMRFEDHADLRPAQVSTEVRRRAAIARALALDPELVIMEQPFQGLPARAAAELLEIARGGESAEGSRRALFMTMTNAPELVERRVERRYRVVHGELVSSS